MNPRLLSLTALATAAAVWVGACGAQPPPPCPVATGNPLGGAPGSSPLAASGVQFSLPNWWAGYTLVTGTGSCADLAGEEVGFQRFEVPGKPDDLRVAIRSFHMGWQKGGANGALDYTDDDYVYRTDPNDPDGAKMSAMGKLTSFPDGQHVCTISAIEPADQTWQAEIFDWTSSFGGTTTDNGGTGVVDADAGTVTYPQTHVKYEWSDLKLVASTEVPGQVLEGQVKITRDACTATYSVKGVWPMTLCHTDLDCSPVATPDAGETEISISGRRFQGSGMNPALEDSEHKLKCNTDPKVTAYTEVYGVGSALGVAPWGMCEVSRPFEAFQK